MRSARRKRIRPLRSDPQTPDYHVDYLLALGWDTWERKLGSVQKENYYVAYVRAGGEVAPKKGKGCTFGGGVKYPVYTRENAHLTDVGFDSNPTLEPGRDVNLYGSFGYRFEEKFSVTAYYDGFDFKRSQTESVTSAATGSVAIFQPASRMSVIGLKLEYRL